MINMSTNFMISGILKGRKLSDNIITAQNKNLNNWTVDQNVDITFANNINTIIYQSSSGIPTYDQIKSTMGINTSYDNYKAFYDGIINDSNTKFGINNYCLMSENSYSTTADYCFFLAYNKDFTMQLLQNGTFNNISYKRAYFPNGVEQNYDNIIGYVDRAYSNNYMRLQYPFFFYNIDKSVSKTVFWKPLINYHADLSVTVENGKDYLLTFDACSPSGFNIDTNQIIVTSGNNIVTETFDNTQSSILNKHIVLFTAGDTSATIKFDFAKMINGNNQIELNIGNLGLYKLEE